MPRRLLNSPWLYFGLAALLAAGYVASRVEIRLPSRPVGTAADIATLRERDDLNLVFVLIDTLRADRLSSYGYERPTSPVLDDLASVGVRFAHVQAQSSWTKCSMASLWTSLYPQHSGVLRFRDALPEKAVLPAEMLRQAGLRTGGIWRNGWIANNFGFGQGFELNVRPTPSRTPEKFERRNPSTHPLQGSDRDATESAIRFVRTHRDERFFLYVHYMDVHQYLYDESSTLFGTGYSDAYDNAIHWVDRNLGMLAAELDRLDLLKRTLIVIAADHGEAFYEHGLEGHARNLYREVTETPLVLALPFRIEGGVVVEPTVRNIDVWPTVLDLMGLAPLPGARGRSLLPLVLATTEATPPAGRSGPSPLAFAQLDLRWGRMAEEPDPLVSLVRGPHRYLHRVNAPERSELYDRSTDPEEQQNLLGEDPALVAELRSDVEAYLAGPPADFGPAEEVEVDEMRREQLRALGYAIP
jgi:arylsulfatase A-like enzyme